MYIYTHKSVEYFSKKEVCLVQVDRTDKEQSNSDCITLYVGQCFVTARPALVKILSQKQPLVLFYTVLLLILGSSLGQEWCHLLCLISV